MGMGFLDGYNTVAKILHWLMALMIIGLLCVGLYMAELPKEDPLRPTLFMMHKSFGITVLFLAFVRLGWRLMNKPPSLDRYTGLVKTIANMTHHSLYLLMFLVPLAGYLMSSYFGSAVDYFGLAKLPILVAKNKEFAEFFEESHEILAFTMMGVIGLHFAGAIKHWLETRNQ